MARRLQELPTVTTILPGSSYILMKDSRNGSPEDFQILADNFLAGKLNNSALNTIGQLPIVNQGARMVDDGTGGPALPAVSGKYLTDLEEVLPDATATIKGVTKLSDNTNSSAGVAQVTAATPLAVKTVNDAKTGRAGDENPTGTWRFNSTGGLKVPVGTTAQQPANEAGLIRYNSTEDTFEGNNGIEWGAIGGTGGLVWSTKNISFIAEPFNGYLVGGANITITLPSSPSDGDIIEFTDYQGTWDTNNVTVNGNGTNIEGVTTLKLDYRAGNLKLVYSTYSGQWEATVAGAGPQGIDDDLFAAGPGPFTLSRTPPSVYAIDVYVGNVWQSPASLTLVGNQLSITGGADADVVVRHLGFPLAIGTPAAGSVGATELTPTTLTRIASAWANLQGTGVPYLRDSYNISSVIENGVGDYTLPFVSMANADFACVLSGKRPAADSQHDIYGYLDRNTPPGTTSVRVLYRSAVANASKDPDIGSVVIFGGQ